MKANIENSSIKKIYSKIPASFYEKVAFVLIIAIIGSHIVNVATMGLGNTNTYIILFGSIGTITVLFGVFYLGSLFVQSDKKIKDILKEIQVWDIALVFMLFWSVLSTILADDKEIAIYGTISRNEGVITYWMYAAYFVCARILKSVRKRKCVLWGMGIMISVMSLISVVQCATGTIGNFVMMYASTLDNINHFAYLLALGILIHAGLVFEEEKLSRKAVSLLLYSLNMWAMIVNTTMGGYVAVLLGVPFLVVIMLVHNKKKWKEAFVVIVLLLGINIGMNLQNGMISENVYVSMYGISEEGLSDEAGSGRIGLWRHAFACIVERPVFGYGPEGFYHMYLNKEIFTDRPHNEFIQHAAFLGIPGLIFYLIALFSLFAHCIKRLKEQNYMILTLGATIVTYCISAFFGNTLFCTAVYYFIVLGLLSGAVKEQGCEENRNYCEK